MNDKLKLYLRRSLIYFVRFAHHKVFVLDIHTLSLLDCLLTEQDPIHTLISMFISIKLDFYSELYMVHVCLFIRSYIAKVESLSIDLH